jgi:hypothetical protein
MVIGSLHIRVILGDVLARGEEETLVVLSPQLVPAGTVDDAAHARLLRRGCWLAPGAGAAAEP